jgi:muramoyltetrapeptide carboxypeptidase
MKPNRLLPGQTIGIASPAWGGAGLFPHRIDQARRTIEALGFRVKLARHALSHRGYASDTPENRAADLHELFLDPEVGAVLAAIGGDHSNQILPFLDFDLIRTHPKILIGYSDITVLNVAIYAATGLVTFNGPAALPDFGEFPQILAYTRESILRVLGDPAPAGDIPAAVAWTEEFLDWSTQADRPRPRRMNLSAGWTGLKPGEGEGHLIGGCIESLDHLRGTRFWPDWKEAIFFFETSEEKPSPARVASLLADYENMGVLAQINGMLVGRPMLYSESEKQELREVILEATGKYHFPIITDMDFGHTAPLMTLPIGCRARIEVGANIKPHLRILEGAVL